MIARKKSPQNTNDKKDDAVDYTTLFFGDERPEPEKVRGLGVLLEDISSKMSQVIEKVDSSEERLGAKIDNVDKKLSEQLDVVKSVLKQHSNKFEYIEAAVTEHSKELSDIKQSIKQLDEKMAKRVDDHEERIVTIEKAVILT